MKTVQKVRVDVQIMVPSNSVPLVREDKQDESKVGRVADGEDDDEREGQDARERKNGREK